MYKKIIFIYKISIIKRKNLKRVPGEGAVVERYTVRGGKEFIKKSFNKKKT